MTLLLSAVRPASSTPGRLVGLPRSPRRPVKPDEEPALAATYPTVLWLLDQFLGKDLTREVVEAVWPWLVDCGELCRP